MELPWGVSDCLTDCPVKSENENKSLPTLSSVTRSYRRTRSFPSVCRVGLAQGVLGEIKRVESMFHAGDVYAKVSSKIIAARSFTSVYLFDNPPTPSHPIMNCPADSN